MEDEGFQDFSLVTPWERFVASIERALRAWTSPQPNHQHDEEISLEVTLKPRLPFRSEPYLLTLHLPGTPQWRAVDEQPAQAAAPPPQMPPPLEESSDADSDAGGVPFSRRSDDDDDHFSSFDEEFEAQAPTGPEGPDADLKAPALDLKGPAFCSPQGQFSEGDHKLHRWFGVRRFALLRPDSYSGRVLSNEEAATLLSAASLALSQCPADLPVFVPVHDFLRDAYWGVAVLEGRTVHFDTDSLHASRRPDALRSVAGQVDAFAGQLAATCPRAEQGLWAAMRSEGGEAGHSSVGAHTAAVSACVTYAVPLPVTLGVDHDRPEDFLFQALRRDPVENQSAWKEYWDDGCVWRPWAAEVDPVGSLEIDLMWTNVPLSAQAPKLNAASANAWNIHALSQERPANLGWSLFYAPTSHRQYLRLPTWPPCPGGPESSTLASHLSEGPSDSGGNPRSLRCRLREVVEGVQQVARAKAVGELLSEAWWGGTAPSLPSDSDLLRSMADLLGGGDSVPGFMTDQCHVEFLDAKDTPSAEGWAKPLAYPWSAPFNSLVWRLAMHAMVYRNPRAVAMLWQKFIHTIRFTYWEDARMLPLPLMPTIGGGPCDGSFDYSEPKAPDLGACLIHQKLQLLAICIFRLRQERERTEHPYEEPGPRFEGWDFSGDSGSSHISHYESANEELSDGESPSRVKSPKAAAGSIARGPPTTVSQDRGGPWEAEGVARQLEDVFLLMRPQTQMNVPITQAAPVYTEDTLAEHNAALSALGTCAGGDEVASRIHDQALASDMAAFMAANPGCVLEDFSRWRMPNGKGHGHQECHSGSNSTRWQQLWAVAKPCPASRQKALMDPLLEGERALHYLETVPPRELFMQLSVIGFTAAMDCLARSPVARLDVVRSRIIQAHRTSIDLIHSQSRASKAEIGDTSCGLCHMLSILQATESLVVLAEALNRRLPGCSKTVEALVAKSLDADAHLPQQRTPVRGEIGGAAAGASSDSTSHSKEPKTKRVCIEREGSTCSDFDRSVCGSAAGTQRDGLPMEGAGMEVDVPMEERPEVSRIMSLQPQGAGRGGGEGQSDKGDALPIGGGWGAARQHEWVTVCHEVGEGGLGVEGGIQHRMYVKDAVDEMRIATVLFAED